MSDHGVQGISMPAIYTPGKTKNQKTSSRALSLATASVMAMQFANHEALADCVPDPAADGDSVVCTGTVNGGFSSSANDIDVTVKSGANLLFDSPGFTFGLKIDGSQNASITVEEGASIIGGGSLFNFGVGLGGDNINFSNSGLITNEGDNVLTVGIFAIDGFGISNAFGSGSIKNEATGIINNTETGIAVISQGSVSIQNNGLVEATHLGIQATATGDNANISFLNFGTIKIADGQNILFSKNNKSAGIGLVLSKFNTSTGTVTGINAGLIETTGLGNTGVLVSADNGVFFNSNPGIIRVAGDPFIDPLNPDKRKISIGIDITGDQAIAVNVQEGVVQATGTNSVAISFTGATSSDGFRVFQNRGLVEATSGTAIQAAEMDDFKVDANIVFAFPPPVANFSVPAIRIFGVEELVFPELERGPPPLNRVLRVILGPDGRPIYPETVDTEEFGTLRLNKQEDGSFLVTNLAGDMLFDVPAVGLNEAVSNSGTIIGDVNLGLGNDGFSTLDNASVVGMVDGGDGTDLLFLQANEGQTIVGDQYKNFETLEKRGVGTTTMTGGLTVDQGTLFEGQFNLAADSILTLDTLTILDGAGFGGNGLLIGDVVNGGWISPGESIGSLTIDGSVEQLATGALLFEIGGTGPGEFDQLIVTEDLSLLGGEIILSFIDDYVPALGDQFDILSAGSITGLENISLSFFGLFGIFEFDLVSFLQDNGMFGLRIRTIEAIAQVPAPSGIGFLMAGLLGLGLYRRRKKAA